MTIACPLNTPAQEQSPPCCDHSTFIGWVVFDLISSCGESLWYSLNTDTVFYTISAHALISAHSHFSLFPWYNLILNMKKICKIYPILAKYFLRALCTYWVGPYMVNASSENSFNTCMVRPLYTCIVYYNVAVLFYKPIEGHVHVRVYKSIL